MSQRRQLRSRLVELGSPDMVERCLEDLRLVVNAAIHLRKRFPHLFPRMDSGFPVRNIGLSQVSSFSPRPLMSDALFDTDGFTSTTVSSTCSTCVSTFRSSSVANFRRPSPTARNRSSLLTLGRDVATLLLSISVRAISERRGLPSIELFSLCRTAFYLILDVAVGGTNGWFPDGAGDKPWLNGAISGCHFSIFGGRND